MGVEIRAQEDSGVPKINVDRAEAGFRMVAMNVKYYSTIMMDNRPKVISPMVFCVQTSGGFFNHG